LRVRRGMGALRSARMMVRQEIEEGKEVEEGKEAEEGRTLQLGVWGAAVLRPYMRVRRRWAFLKADAKSGAEAPQSTWCCARKSVNGC